MADTGLSFKAVFGEHFVPSLLAGAVAGTAVDISLYPLDTIKTRVQSQVGFAAAGGFRKVYSGIGPVILGSAPTAALFFCSYESTKVFLRKSSHQASPSSNILAVHHMTAAALGEIVACFIRVPVENVKQKAQARKGISSRLVYRTILLDEGIRGFYRGYLSTVIREIPFAIIQFPLWEFLKAQVAGYNDGRVGPMQSAICGGIAGATAAAITTPLDVAKTRIMLAEKNSMQARGKVSEVLRKIYVEKGIKGLFAGLEARVSWIAIGGFIFLGAYEKAKRLLIP